MRTESRRARLALLALLLPAARPTAHDLAPAPAQSRPVLLRGGDLHTVSRGVLPATDLVFDGGRIVAIGPGLPAPPGAEVVDVAGRRVYPGFIAPQTTLGLVEIGAVRATSDLVEVGAVTPEAAAHTAFNPDSELIPTVRSHGITTVQVVPQGSLLRGRPFLTHLDGWTKEQSAVRLLAGQALSWPAEVPRDPPRSARRRRAGADPAAERREELARLGRAFGDARAYLAGRDADPAAPVDLRWEALRAVLAREEPLFVAAESYGQILEAVEFAAAENVRLVLVGGAEAWRLTDLLLGHDVAVIVGDTLGLPQRADDGYDAAFRLPALLHAAGVRFCLADVGGSWSVRNLPLHGAQAVAFGLPEEAALRALTLSTAEILGIADRQGSLDPGKDATLFVSEGDALDSPGRRVTRMWIEGRAVDLDDRHKALERKYRLR